MYCAYLDDSGRGSGPTYVIAGFLSTTNRWQIVSQEWKELRNIAGLDYFKMKEAMDPGARAKQPGQYYGWPREEIDELVDLFTELIWRRVSIRIRITIPNRSYEGIFKGKISPQVDFPYWLAHVSAMLETTRLLALVSINEKVDFIFDTASKREQYFVLNAWHFWKANEWLSERKVLFGDPPIFGDDKIILPLQAADLYAWHARKERQVLSEGGVYDDLGWRALNDNIKIKAERDWTENDLEQQLENVNVIRNLNNWGAWHYEKKAVKQKGKC